MNQTLSWRSQIMQRVLILRVFLIAGCFDGNNVGRQDPLHNCTPPQPALACHVTSDCDNYPNTVCGQNGFCGCPSTDTDAGTCTPPQPALACHVTADCGNYPDTVCGQNGYCDCPSAHTSPDAGTCTPPQP